MNSIRHFIAHWSTALWGVLHPLGAWGVFAIAGVDGAGVPLPGAVDAVVASYVYASPLRAWFCILVASVGSSLGCLVVYGIGYAGGEALLHRRVPKAKFAEMQRKFDENALLTLMVPALLPPPFPFKIFILSAGAFEIPIVHFLLAVFAGRVIRFSVLSVLVVLFGPQIVTFTATLFRRHLVATLLVLAAVVVLVLVLHRARRKDKAVVEEQKA